MSDKAAQRRIQRANRQLRHEQAHDGCARTDKTRVEHPHRLPRRRPRPRKGKPLPRHPSQRKPV